MNELEYRLSRARRRREVRFVTAATGAVILVFLLGGILFYSLVVVRLQLVIFPEDAVDIAVETVEGRATLIGGYIYALDGPLTLGIRAEGFAAAVFPVEAAARAQGRIEVVLRPLPARLIATSIPERDETEWVVDESLIAQGPRIDVEIEPGERVLRARHPYFVPALQTITAGRGKIHVAELKLTPVAGRVAVTSEPAGADVILNAASVGRTPLTLSLSGGVHTLRIEHAGYVTHTDSIEVTNLQPHFDRHYQLRRRMVPVSFALSPPDGLLSVNGQAVLGQRELRLREHTAHRARYTKPGYTPKEVTFTLGPGKPSVVELKLAPIYGDIDIRSEPQADIEIDGRSAGRTPQRLRLRAVPHTIRFMRSGYEPATRVVTPENATSQSIKVLLQPIVLPPRYVNKAGIEFKLYRTPGEVVLGARRGEPGRRANEFVRRVRLTRAFYAGIHEVTIAQFRRFTHPNAPAGTDRRPATGVSWQDAARFCNWLSRQEGLTPVYAFTSEGRHTGSDPDANGYRLPTEAEWEWLARKAGRSRQTRFTWGDEAVLPPMSANIADESAKGKVAVYVPRYTDGFAALAETGKFVPNAAGIHDLAGNAREWVHDIYDLQPPPEGRIEVDPMDVRPGGRRVVKGSSWRSGTLNELRAAWRKGSDTPQDDLGFRVVRYAEGDS